MALFTKSKFYFDFVVTTADFVVPFDEGSGELSAEVVVGSYAMSDLPAAIATAMNEAGTQTYTVTVDRDTRKFNIAASSNFDLLWSSAVVTTLINDIIGFDVTDLTGTNTYEGQNSAGSEYLPQYKLQDYVDFEDNQSASNSTTHQSASGKVQTVNFGQVKIMESNITYATDISMPKADSPIENNPNGIADLRAFMEFATKKSDIEFMPDRDTTATFTKCLLESTKESKDGTAFRLKELYQSGLTNYFETGRLQFREVV